MKKLLVTSLGFAIIFVIVIFTQIHLYAVPAHDYKMSIYVNSKCDGYWVRCGLPGNECDRVVNPICIPWPGDNF